MKKIIIKKIFLISITLFSVLTFGQSTEIKIRFIGNAALHLSDGKQNIYIDFPYVSGAFKYMEYPESELDSIKENSIFLFTHGHKDHYSRKLLKIIKGKKYGNWNIDELKTLNDSISYFSVQGIKTSHKFSLKHYSYILTWHKKRIFISGDIEKTDVLKTIENIDWAFLNSWVYIDSISEKIKVDAKMFGIYHLYPNVKIKKGFPENSHFLTEPNEIIKIKT